MAAALSKAGRPKKKRYPMKPIEPLGNPSTTFNDLKNIIPDEQLNLIIEYIDFVILIVDGTTNSWIPIKQYLQRALPKPLRVYLSHRDPATRKQKPNDFDFACMNYWKEKTGVELFIPKDKLHPTDHVYRPKGWNIIVHNEIKSRQRYAKENKGKQKTYKRFKGRPKKNEQIIIDYFAKNSNQRSNHS